MAIVTNFRTSSFIILWSVHTVLLLPGSVAFEWTQDIHNGSTVHRCVGDDVTLRWSYVTRSDENVMAIFWYSDKNGTIASRFFNHYMTSSSRVTYEPNAGVTLSGLSTDDEGMYGVQVRMFGTPRLQTQVVKLVVVEPPRTADGLLHVEEQSHTSLSTGNDVCGSQVQLMCGQFLSPGVPPFSVMWTDPEGNQHTSSDYHDGYFLLNLPSSHKGGNYTCSLVLDPEVSGCLKSDSHLMTPASLFLETAETKVIEQEKNLEQLKTEVQQFKSQALGLQLHNIDRFMDEVEQRLTSLESSAENITDSLQNQEHSTRMLDDMSMTRIADLQDTFRDALSDHEKRMEQSLDESGRSFSRRLDALSSSLFKQQVTSAAQRDAVKGLREQLEILQDNHQQQQALTSQLTSKLATAEKTINEQKAASAALEKRLVDQHNEIEQRKKINAERVQALADLQSSMAAVLRRLEKQESSSRELGRKLTEQQREIDQQKTASAEQERINAQFLPTLAKVQSSLEEQETATNDLRSNLQQTANEQEVSLSDLKQQVSDLQLQHDDFSAETNSQLSTLEQTLESVKENLIEPVRFEQRTLRESLQNSTEIQSVAIQRLQTRLSQLSDVVTEVKNSSTGQSSQSSQLSVLQRDLTAAQKQYQALLPRLQSVENRLQSVTANINYVRLVGGSTALEGRVEIRVGQQWGTVCDDSWDNNDAKVVCAMLGYFGVGAVARSSAAFGRGTGPIVLDDVACTGSEQDIRTCSARIFGTHNCNHNEDAGVVCSP